MKNESDINQNFAIDFKKFLQNSLLKDYNDLQTFEDLTGNFLVCPIEQINLDHVFKNNQDIILDNILQQSFQYREILNFYMNFENAIQIDFNSEVYMPSLLDEELKRKDFDLNKISFVSSVLKSQSQQSIVDDFEKNEHSILKKDSQQRDFRISNYLNSAYLEKGDTFLEKSFLKSQRDPSKLLNIQKSRKSQQIFSINSLENKLNYQKSQDSFCLNDQKKEQNDQNKHRIVQQSSIEQQNKKYTRVNHRKHSQMDKLLHIKVPISSNTFQKKQRTHSVKKTMHQIQSRSPAFGRNSQLQSIKDLCVDKNTEKGHKKYQSFTQKITNLQLPQKANSHFYQKISTNSIKEKQQKKPPSNELQKFQTKPQIFVKKTSTFNTDESFNSNSSSNDNSKQYILFKEKSNVVPSDSLSNDKKVSFVDEHQNINNNDIQQQIEEDKIIKKEQIKYFKNSQSSKESNVEVQSKSKQKNLNQSVIKKQKQQTPKNEQNDGHTKNEQSVPKISQSSNLKDQQIHLTQQYQKENKQIKKNHKISQKLNYSIQQIDKKQEISIRKKNCDFQQSQEKVKRWVLEKSRSEQHKQNECVKRKNIKSENCQPNFFDNSSFNKEFKKDLKEIFDELNLEEKIKSEIRKNKKTDFCNQRTVKKKKKSNKDRDLKMDDQQEQKKLIKVQQKQDKQYNFNINITFVFKESQNKHDQEKENQSIEVQKQSKTQNQKLKNKLQNIKKSKYAYKPKQIKKKHDYFQQNENKTYKSTNVSAQRKILPQISKIKKLELSPKKFEIKKNILNINKNLNEQIQKLQNKQNKLDNKKFSKKQPKLRIRSPNINKKKFLSPYDLKYSNQILKQKYNMKIVTVEPEKLLCNKNIYSLKYKLINLKKKNLIKQQKQIQNKV